MKTITLKKPLKRGETEITQFEMREPTAGELRGIRLTDLLNGDVEAVITVLPRITSPILQQHELAGLGAKDLGEISGQLMDFFVGAD
jgi:hypothetical protein